MTAAFLVAAALLQAQAANAELGYKFAVPEGFAAFPEARQQDVVDCWSEPAAATAAGGLILCVQRLHGVLPREGLRQEDLPPAARLMHFPWKGFSIDGLRTDTVESGAPVVVFAAQVPLRHEAVQLIVTGPGDQAARAEAIMTSTLATLEGETNWLTSAERSGRLGNIVGWVVGIAVAVLLVRMWKTRRQSQSG
jgi:hypothetical protein